MSLKKIDQPVPTIASFRLKIILLMALFIIVGKLSAFEIIGYVPYYRLPPSNKAYGGSAFNWSAHSTAVLDSTISLTSKSSDNRIPFLEYLATQIFEGRITQLNYFGVHPGKDGQVDWGDARPSHLDLLTRLRAVVPFRLALTVAGGANRFVMALATPARRSKFLQQLNQIVIKWDIDEIDFDWEFPRGMSDLSNYVQLIIEAKKVFGQQVTVSVAIARRQLLTKELFQAVDQVNLMAYDFAGKHSTYEAADEMILYLTKRFDVEPEKLVLGIPLYARIYSLKSSNYRHAISYYRLMQRYRPTPQQTEVDGYYFNNYDIVRRKIQLARTGKLAGIMFWELGQDLYDSRSIVRTTLP